MPQPVGAVARLAGYTVGRGCADSPPRPGRGPVSRPHLILSALLLAVGCTDTQLKVINTAPEANVLLPTDGAAFVQDADAVVFRGQVGDADQAEDGLDVVWLSDRDGTLGAAPPDADGITVLELAAEDLSTGQHTVTLTVTDDKGLSASDTVSLSIVPPDDAPTVAITEPSDGAVFDAGESVTFVGEASDARDDAGDLVYEWESDTDGVLDEGSLSSAGEARFTLTLEEGLHTLTLRVTDTEGNAAEAAVTVEAQHVNEAPEASITDPRSGDGAKVGVRATFTGLVSDAEDDPADLSVTWSSDVDGELYASSPDSAGATTFSTDALSIGDHAITLTVEDTGGEVATATIAFEVYEENSPPGEPVVAISPTDPDTADDLVVFIVTEAEDEDGDAVSYTYQWYRDSALMSGYTDETVAAAHTAKGETWMVEVTATDGEDDGRAASAEVTVVNTPPAITGATISPSDPMVDDTLTCTGSGWSDADGDTADYNREWTVDGAVVSTAETLSGAFVRGDEVGCTLTPFDGDDAGDPVDATSVTVGNAPPTAPEIAIDPAYPTDDDDLVVIEEVEATDPDGDALDYTWEWTRNGAVTADDSDAVAAADTTIDEVWTVTVTVDDGWESATSDPFEVRIWPGEGDLVVTEFMPDPSAVADARGEFVEIWNATDVDIDLTDHTLEDYDYDCVDLSGLTITAGGYVVICVEEDTSANGGIGACDVVATWDTGYTAGCNQLALANTSDEVAIVNPAGTTDAVVYTSSWVRTGKATGLDPDLYDAALNDSSSSWCAQSSVMTAGDKATPGDDNDTCP